MKKMFLSISDPFTALSPEKIIEIAKEKDTEKIIKGFELALTQKYRNYALHFTEIANKAGYKISLHSFFDTTDTDLHEYMLFANKIQYIMEEKINITFHPIYTNDATESIEKTWKLVKNIYNMVDKFWYNKKFSFNMENCDYKKGCIDRRKTDLVPYFLLEKRLGFTYDVGHDFRAGVEVKKLPGLFEERLRVLHVHATNKNNTKRHYIIEDIEKEETIKNTILKYGDENLIVLEYDLRIVEGKDPEEKLEKMIESVKTFKKLQ